MDEKSNNGEIKQENILDNVDKVSENKTPTIGEQDLSQNKEMVDNVGKVISATLDDMKSNPLMKPLMDEEDKFKKNIIHGFRDIIESIKIVHGNAIIDHEMLKAVMFRMGFSEQEIIALEHGSSLQKKTIQDMAISKKGK